MFRPRGGLARVVYEKIHTDARLQSLDKEKWYCIDDIKMQEISQENWKKFIPLGKDEETEHYLEKCHDVSDNTFWQLWLTIASSMLSWVLNPTSINGLLGRGSMHVFSTKQFQTFIGWNEDNPRYERLLDIGAGDGQTTETMASYFNQVDVTEMSTTMKWALEKKRFNVLDVSTWHETSSSYDMVSCLNVFDRCDTPLTLLKNIYKVLKPQEGLALVSFVIPFNPYVEFESTTHRPTELLPIKGESFEEEVNNFIEKVLKPNNWEVIRWTRLPYLCEGDIKQAYYYLDDAVFLIRPSTLL